MLVLIVVPVLPELSKGAEIAEALELRDLCHLLCAFSSDFICRLLAQCEGFWWGGFRDVENRGVRYTLLVLGAGVGADL